jgi:hypothetical protein
MAKKSSGGKPQRGPRGFAGKRGAPGIEPNEIHAIIENIEKIQDEATVSFKRIAQMQVQLDATLKALKDMGDRAGRQRKRR